MIRNHVIFKINLTNFFNTSRYLYIAPIETKIITITIPTTLSFLTACFAFYFYKFYELNYFLDPYFYF